MRDELLYEGPFYIQGEAFDFRIDIDAMRALKSKHRIDLADTSPTSIVFKFCNDFTVVLDVAFALYKDRFEGIEKQADFDRLMDEEIKENPKFQKEFTDAMVEGISGFFPLLRTVYITMEKARRGDLPPAAVE